MDQLSELRGGTWTETPTLWTEFETWVHKTPDALALVVTHQAPNLFGFPNISLDGDSYREKPYLRWSYKSVHNAISRLVNAWQKLGVQEGSTVVTFIQNSAEYVIVAYAAVCMGCKFMAISPRNLINVEEAIHMVNTGLSISQGGKKLVVVTGNNDLAKQVDELGVFPADALKITLAQESPVLEWIPFESLMGETGTYGPLTDLSGSLNAGTILFTSGTTAFPKGLFHTYQESIGRVLYHQSSNMTSGKRLCGNLPNNHAMGWTSTITMLSIGSAIVFPGIAFDPSVMIEVIFTERISMTILVPTMVYALVAAKAANPKYANRQPSDLELALLAGAPLTIDVVRLAIEELGVKGVENYYGSTEGLLVGTPTMYKPEQLAEGEYISTGGPMAGFTIRVVDPETGKTVPRNVLGEIHACGPCLPRQYIGDVGKDSWYRDEKGVLWYKSGDQGKVTDQGQLFVTGRYKDMIIRGGENISPSAVEAVLSKNPLLAPLIPQIVGVKDTIAGEVPVAVIKGKVTSEIRDTIQDVIVHQMGTLYVPEDVVSIEDLALTDYPRTLSGKIQKTKVTALVNEYLSKQANTNDDANGISGDQLTEDIKAIWAKVVGLDSSHIELDRPIMEFADSINIMRARAQIKKRTGKTLLLSDMKPTGTIGEQVKILQSMGTVPEKNKAIRPGYSARQGPPAVEDMVHLAENPDLFEPTRELVHKTISKFGFEWNDVEDIMPAYDFNVVMTQTGVFDTWCWDFSIQPKSKVSKTQLRAVFEAVASNNRILASFLVWDSDALGPDDALHVVMKRSPKLFDLMIEDGGELETVKEFMDMASEHLNPKNVQCPGPLYRALLFDVKEIGGAAMIVSISHSIMDASLMNTLTEDFDKALAVASINSNATTSEVLSNLNSHVDYKVWADTYYNLRTSVEARVATKWHIKRLKSLSEHFNRGLLVPPAPPGHQWTLGPGSVEFAVDMPGIQALREKYPHITAAVILKGAVVLLNAHRTGHSHAVLGSLEAARSYFPFIPKAMLDNAVSNEFEATDVGGPVFQMVFDVVEVNKSAKETVVGFLERMQDNQTAISKYATAPLQAIMKGLNDISPGTGDLLPKIAGSAHFNWVPGFATATSDMFQNYNMAATARSGTGACFHAGLGGEKNQTVFVRVIGDGFRVSLEDARLMGEQILAITKWLVTEDNWSSPITQFNASLASM